MTVSETKPGRYRSKLSDDNRHTEIYTVKMTLYRALCKQATSHTLITCRVQSPHVASTLPSSSSL